MDNEHRFYYPLALHITSEGHMTISKTLLPEFDHEMTSTRRALERVPDDKFGWKPHDKSMSLGGLATHLANIPTWASLAITQDSFDMNPQDGPPARVAQAESRAEVLERFDKNVADARRAITDASDEQLM